MDSRVEPGDDYNRGIMALREIAVSGFKGPCLRMTEKTGSGRFAKREFTGRYFGGNDNQGGK
ncbi:hypothetical protein [Prosthecochloris sp.]|uniref:hypothetical protein n=1 Tax=Prosthecochloris sp. TaxID=290513 RepID=UPI0025CF197A|nr:hypothetical protein [Prosthecochloris sp.]